MKAKLLHITYEKPIHQGENQVIPTKLVAEVHIEDVANKVQVNMIILKTFIGVKRYSKELQQIIVDNSYENFIDIKQIEDTYILDNGENTKKYVNFLKNEMNNLHSKE